MAVISYWCIAFVHEGMLHEGQTYVMGIFDDTGMECIDCLFLYLDGVRVSAYFFVRLVRDAFIFGVPGS